MYVTDNYNSGTGVSSFFITGDSNGDSVTSSVFKSGIINRNGYDSPGIVNTAHNLGTVPKKITFYALLNSGNGIPIISNGVFDESGNNSIRLFGNNIETSSTYSIFINYGISTYQRGIVSVDDTNIIINWSVGSDTLAGNISILYSAQS